MLKKEMTIQKKQYEWPENYYLETDPSRRKKMLEEALHTENSPENELRSLLWQKRYADAKGKVDGFDHFLKIWTELPFITAQAKGLFGKKKACKFIEEMQNVLQLDLLAGQPQHQKIWLDEFMNFCCLYIEISRKDKSYSTTLFGVGKLSDDNLAHKMAEDLYQRTVVYPKELGIFEKQTLLMEAAKKAYRLYFPDKENFLEKFFGA